MKTLILSGSRNPTGQTAQAAGAFLQGVLEAGAQGEIVFLAPLHIERCRQCNEQGRVELNGRKGDLRPCGDRTHGKLA